MEKIYMDTSKIMKALSDPKRLRIADMLSHGELCASSIQNAFNISQPTLSHDMRILKEAGVTNERREGKNVFYSLNQTTLDGFTGCLSRIFSEGETFVRLKSVSPNNE